MSLEDINPTMSTPERAPCEKRFEKSGHLLHSLHKFHNFFSIVIWLVIIVLLIDYYQHILPHSTHEVILWGEFICYTLFLYVPVVVGIYRKYKVNQCQKNLKTQ